MSQELPPDGKPTEPGLRERKKAATRLALAHAALKLAVKHGLDNVRVEDIAAAADVSPRTYNNYFSSKEQAIVHLSAERAERVMAAVRDAPASADLGTVLTDAFTAPYETGPKMTRQEIQARALIFKAPALRGELLRQGAGAERELAAILAKRLGIDPAADATPRVLAAALMAARRAAIGHWLEQGAKEPLERVMRAAIGCIVAGIGKPPRPTRRREA